MKTWISSIVLAILLFANLALFTSVKDEPATKMVAEETAPSSEPESFYNIGHAIKLPESIDFAEEQVPLDIFDVKERLDREMLVNTYWHSNTLYHMKLAGRWFSVIEPILKEQGVPDDFKYLAVAESGLQQVVSPSRAAGFWQFLSSTGKEYGLEVDDDVDERYHVEKATYAACKYLKEAKEKFGSWTLAAASYNMGMPGLNRRINDQKVEDYYDLLLNRETSRYIFRIIAIKEIHSNHEKYGFKLDKDDRYQPIATKTITVNGPISSIADFAKENGTNYKMIKLLNPWLRLKSLKNPSRKTYQIKIPA